MDKAKTLAQRWVTVPQKDGADWVVWWLSGAKVIRSASTTAEDAYNFYYCKIRQLIQKLNKQKEYK